MTPQIVTQCCSLESLSLFIHVVPVSLDSVPLFNPNKIILLLLQVFVSPYFQFFVQHSKNLKTPGPDQTTEINKEMSQ